MSDGLDPESLRRLLQEQEQLAVLDRILADSAQTFAGIDQEPKLRMMLGFVATLALRDLCRVKVAVAREQRTQLLRRLDEVELAAAAERAYRIARDRHHTKHVLAGAVWASVGNAITALRIQRHLDRSGQDHSKLKYAENVVDAVLGRIDTFVAAYVEAEAAELEEAGLSAAARMVDPTASTNHPPNSRRGSESPAAEGGSAVRPNPATLLFTYVIAAYAWQLHGWPIAIGAAAGYLAILLVVNNLVIFRLAPEDTTLDGVVRILQRVKWVTFALFMIGMGISGMQSLPQ